jgi:hypothetical protein
LTADAGIAMRGRAAATNARADVTRRLRRRALGEKRSTGQGLDMRGVM